MGRAHVSTIHAAILGSSRLRRKEGLFSSRAMSHPRKGMSATCVLKQTLTHVSRQSTSARHMNRWSLDVVMSASGRVKDAFFDRAAGQNEAEDERRRMRGCAMWSKATASTEVITEVEIQMLII